MLFIQLSFFNKFELPFELILMLVGFISVFLSSDKYLLSLGKICTPKIRIFSSVRFRDPMLAFECLVLVALSHLNHLGRRRLCYALNFVLRNGDSNHRNHQPRSVGRIRIQTMTQLFTIILISFIWNTME